MIRANYKIPRGMGRGLILRDMQQAPLGSSAPMFSRPLIARSEWGDRIAEKKKHKAMLSDIRNISGPNGGMIPALNQGRDPWCWAFSPTISGDTCAGVGRIAVQASQRQRGRQHGHGVQSAWRMVRKRHEVRPGEGRP
jgi:hypothetical protein